MLTQYFLNIALYLLFVFLGYRVSGRINPPRTTQTWTLWIVLVVFAGGVCASSYAVNINDAVVLRFDDMLQAIGIGVLIGFVIAKSKQAKLTTI